jgi:hypothetical protein
MLEQTLKPVVEVSFQIVQPIVSVLRRLGTALPIKAHAIVSANNYTKSLNNITKERIISKWKPLCDVLNVYSISARIVKKPELLNFLFSVFE